MLSPNVLKWRPGKAGVTEILGMGPVGSGVAVGGCVAVDGVDVAVGWVGDVVTIGVGLAGIGVPAGCLVRGVGVAVGVGGGAGAGAEGGVDVGISEVLAVGSIAVVAVASG